MMVDWEVFQMSEPNISPVSPQLDVPDKTKFITKLVCKKVKRVYT